MAHDETHYDVLGVEPSASQQIIRTAYLKLVAQYHPDRHQGNPLEELARQRLVRVNEAYQTLNDAERRSSYDRELAHRSGGFDPGRSPSSHHAGAGSRTPGPWRSPTALILLVVALPLLARIFVPVLRMIGQLLRALLSIL